MADSLRDQLLKSGLVKEVREEKRPSGPSPRHGKPASASASSASGQPYAGDRPKHGGKPQQGAKGPQGGGQGGRQGQGSNNGKPRHHGGKPGAQGNPRPPRNDGEIDLAKAYAMRAQTDAAERRRIEAEAAEVARQRKEKKRKVEELLKDKALNRADADQVRHFPYGEKIRRVYLDTAQLAAVNAGELGIVQQNGRYLVVEKSVIDALREIGPEFIALMVDPNAVDESDDGVPDDLMW